MPHLTLYHTLGCHLCEEAEALALACLAEHGWPTTCLSLQEIAEQPTLLQRYGVLIPVLRDDDSGQELRWPFTPEAIANWLGC